MIRVSSSSAFAAGATRARHPVRPVFTASPGVLVFLAVFLLAPPLATAEDAKPQDPEMTAVLTPDPEDSHDLALVLGGDGNSTVVEIDGRAYVRSSPQGMIYFDVASSFAADGDWSHFAVEVEYLDRGTGSIWLQYDSRDREVRILPTIPGAFKQADGEITLRDSGQPRTHRFTIRDALFSKRCNSADFRLRGPSEFHIAKTTLAKLTPSLGLVPEARVYPNSEQTPETMFTLDTLSRGLTNIFTWRQGPGRFGNLTLHACWGESSVLRRKYHGHYTSLADPVMEIACTLYERTGEYRWKQLAVETVHNVMFLQEEGGGFFHGAAEFEPVYTASSTCPIHQYKPILALLKYAEQPFADPELKREVKRTIDTHWAWFNDFFWKRGNGSHYRIDWPGWCAVTNQDLVVVAGLAKYGKVFGDFSRYEEFGKPVLDTYLGPKYYYEELGLFERGDSKGWNFPERTTYYPIIVDMLEMIHAYAPDERIPGVIDRVCKQLFDSAYVEKDGLVYMSWGVATRKTDGKTEITHRIKYPIAFAAIVRCAEILGRYVERHPDADPEKRRIVEGLRTTMAQYINTHGTMPAALNERDGTFLIAASSKFHVPLFLLRELGNRVKEVRTNVQLPCVRREYANMAFIENATHYEILRDDKRAYAGFKLEPKGIVIGEEETLAGVTFESLRQVDLVERIVFAFDTEKTFK